MGEQEWFSGKLRKQSLPVVEPGEEDQPLLKRLPLVQGDLAQVHDSEEGMRFIAVLELKTGSVRGNHSHREKEESFYLVSGELELHAEDLESGEREVVMLAAGDLAVIRPGGAHALRVLQPGLAVEFAPQRYDPADTIRREVI